MAKPKLEDRYYTKEEAKKLTQEQKLTIITGFFDWPIKKWHIVQFGETRGHEQGNKVVKEWLVSRARFCQLCNFINLLNEENPNSKLLANLKIQYKHDASLLIEMYGAAIIYVTNPERDPSRIPQPQTHFI